MKLLRIASVLLAATGILFGLARAAGEYQGFEPFPDIVDIHFNRDAIDFAAAAEGLVPGGARYLQPARGADDWMRISREAARER